jgi:hypothetical protein
LLPSIVAGEPLSIQATFKMTNSLKLTESAASDNSPLIRLDKQEYMDKEILAAKKGGLDYWAFCY